jgi:hypothetical protein
MFFGEGEIDCPKCGRRWRLMKRNLIQRDPDSFECRCGETLHKWNGAVMYDAELVRPIPEDKEYKSEA